MNDPDKNARSIFLEIVENSPPERWPESLDQACGDELRLRTEVQRLLDAHLEIGDFMDRPAVAPFDAAAIDQPIAEGPGTLIGPYKLMEQIGEGGFGLVFVAEQRSPVRRQVGLKIIKPGMDTRQVIARFEAERQALALMDHPNIAKVFDAGTTDSGRPYFVMELVRGVPITQYCDEHNLTVRERLELFTTLCHAIQHAHQKGIIHRDVKPTNVLVTLLDGTPVPKVIDFGVAKALSQRLTEQTVYTQFAQMIGTPLYMSPEQAEMSGLDIDTRSDIYSLGVVLYELLTGTTPFDRERLKAAAADEIRRIVREEDPLTPSARLSALGRSGLPSRTPAQGPDRQARPTLETTAAQRRTEPARLTKQVHGELDWIVMKCLEKDRNRRYETANGLARDVERYLADEPVQACPPSISYRFGKFARRNKVAIAIATLVAAVLVGAVALLSITNARIRQASVAKDAALATAREAVDQMLTRTADEKLLNVPLAEPLRRALLEDALRFYEGFLRQSETDPAIRLETALVLRRVSNIQRELGRGQNATSSLERSIEQLRLLAASEPAEPTYREQLAAGLVDLAYTVLSTSNAGSDDVAESHLRDALRLYEGLQHDFPARPQDTGDCFRHLGDIVNRRGDRNDAERLYRMALAQQQACALRTANVQTWVALAWGHASLGRVLSAKGERRDAEKMYLGAIDAAERALTIDPQSKPARYARALNTWVLLLEFDNGRWPDRGIVQLRKVIEEAQSLVAESPWLCDYWRLIRGSIQLIVERQSYSGHPEEPRQTLVKTSEFLQRISPQISHEFAPLCELAHCQFQVAWALRSIGDEDDAARLMELAVVTGAKCEGLAKDSTTGDISAKEIRLLMAFEDLLHEAASPSVDKERILQSFQHAAEQYDESSRQSSEFDRRMDLAIRYTEVAGRLATMPKDEAVFAAFERQFWKVLEGILRDCPKLKNHRASVGHRLRLFALALQSTGEYEPHIQRALEEALQVFHDLTIDFPDFADAWRYLADTHKLLGDSRARSQRLDLAESEYFQAIDLFDRQAAMFDASRTNDSEHGPDAIEALYSLALVRLRQDDSAGYREACAELAKLTGPIRENLRDRPAWTCALGPAALTDLSVPLKYAEGLVAENPDSAEYLTTLSAVLYRAARYEEAAKRSEETIAAFASDKSGSSSPIYAQLFLAMTKWQQGERDEARRLLAETKPAIDEAIKSPATSWNRRATLELLRREAETLTGNNETTQTEEREEQPSN